MKTATIEILEKDETILGSPTNGQYMVREFEDGVEMGGRPLDEVVFIGLIFIFGIIFLDYFWIIFWIIFIIWDYVGLKFDKAFVENIDLFKKMTVREAKIATLMSFTVDLKEDEVLFRQGDMGREMFVLLNGKVRIYLEQGYEQTELAVLEKGENGRAHV